jgi:hypothetical protein
MKSDFSDQFHRSPSATLHSFEAEIVQSVFRLALPQ